MDELIRMVKKTALSAVLLPMRLIPLKRNRIIILNELNGRYSGNPRYIAEYLLKKHPGEFELIIPVKSKGQFRQELGGEVRFVVFNSLSYFYYAMTAKVFITNSGGFSYLPLRRREYVINTWHGGGAYKSIGTDMYENTFLFRHDMRMSAKKTNVFLSTNKRFSNVINSSMLINRKTIWEIGMPRNDMLIHQDAELRETVRKKIGLTDDKKLVLFAPTYRKINDNYYNDSVGIDYGLDVSRVLAAFKKRFGCNWVMGYRFHPCVRNRDELVTGGNIDLSDYDEIQELLLAADAVISDFSSVVWDYMLTGKPCFMFAIDMEDYIRNTKVYTPLKEWPFPKAVNNDEMVSNILDFNEQDYAAECRKHYDLLGGCETGKATKLVCRRIEKICLGDNKVS